MVLPLGGTPCGGSCASPSPGRSTELSGITPLEAREREREGLSGAALGARERAKLGRGPEGLGGIIGLSGSITVDGAVGLELTLMGRPPLLLGR